MNRPILPSLIKNPLIEVFFQAGDPPFICGAHGHITTWMLDEIERDINENISEILTRGDGVYLFEATRFEGQYGDQGMCEISPGWELEMVVFYPEHNEGLILDELAGWSANNKKYLFTKSKIQSNF